MLNKRWSGENPYLFHFGFHIVHEEKYLNQSMEILLTSRAKSISHWYSHLKIK